MYTADDDIDESPPSSETSPGTISKSKYMTVIIFCSFTEWSTSASPINITPCDKQAGASTLASSHPWHLLTIFWQRPDQHDSEIDQSLCWTSSSRGKNEVWSTDTAEIRAYLGFMILMGINELPELRDYWSTHEYLRYAPIADRILCNQFEKITAIPSLCGQHLGFKRWKLSFSPYITHTVKWV